MATRDVAHDKTCKLFTATGQRTQELCSGVDMVGVLAGWQTSCVTVLEVSPLGERDILMSVLNLSGT